MTTQSLYTSPAAEKAVMALYDHALANWPVQYETLNLQPGSLESSVAPLPGEALAACRGPLAATDASKTIKTIMMLTPP